MSQNAPTKQMSGSDLANQLFDAVSQYQKDPKEVVRQVILFLSEALIYSIQAATPVDENARKALLKSVGESIAVGQSPGASAPAPKP